VFLYLSLLISYLRNSLFHSDLLLVGAECHVRWEWQDEPDLRIISFAPEPEGDCPFDDYGWHEAFAHLNGLPALMRFIRHGRRMGHEFVSVKLCYGIIAE
jgi:hypothetical protein